MENSVQEKMLRLMHHGFHLVRRGKTGSFHRACGHKRGKGRVLNLLIEKGPLSRFELLELFEIRPVAFKDVLAKLEAKGFIKIEGEIVDITEAGKAKAQEISDLRQTIAENMTAGLTADEQAQLVALLEKFVNGLEDKLAGEDKKCGEFYLRKGPSFRKPEGGRCRHHDECHGK